MQMNGRGNASACQPSTLCRNDGESVSIYHSATQIQEETTRVYRPEGEAGGGEGAIVIPGWGYEAWEPLAALNGNE